MIEEETILDLFVKGSNNLTTTDSQDISKPFVVRGVIKKDHISRCVEQNRNYYYVDTGYFGNFKSPGNPSGKKLFTRIVKNDLQKCFLETFPDDRWTKLEKIDPRLKWKGWKKTGSKVLVILPNPKACRFYNFEFDSWYNNTITTIKNNTDREIIIREKGTRSERHINSIYHALDQDIFVTVAFNSIAAMESVAYGIPAFTTVNCAATPLVEKDLSKIENPYYPDPDVIRQQCCNLAYGQFTNEEIENGYAWNIVK
jgi:hypothetical protein